MKEDNLVHAASETDGPPNGQQSAVPTGKTMGPIIIRKRFYPTQCEHCDWVGSSEDCGTGDYFAQDDIICPSCCQSMRGDDPESEHMHRFVEEAAAQAIRDAVIEECASAIFAKYSIGITATEVCDILRSLKSSPQRQGDRPELPNDGRQRETNGPQL